ncbi:5-methylcytosine-specific restriction endonuclease McrA [Algoriphagus sp. 4150]|uniref:hypothetical protein n=1 Tax=Algoriphagus sp. 4150 TaxID=2817756 RepID=UPI0028612D6E|nr:hypothetical protein [Algoriphagus sp. 4150]MDR7130681.1 5-methylcytosine-specific restriction endonuclease McrA [Algoriphagus sp. 4150]
MAEIKATKVGWDGETDPFYQSAKWKKVRKKYIDLNPLDELKLQYGIVSAGIIVDHIIPRRLYTELEFNELNFQTLDFKSHQQKTAQTRGINTLQEFLDQMENGKLMNICSEEKRLGLIDCLKT